MIDQTWNGMSKHPVNFLATLQSNDSYLNFFFADISRSESNLINVIHSSFAVIYLPNRVIKKNKNNITYESGIFIRKPGDVDNFETLGPISMKILIISNAYIESLFGNKFSEKMYYKINSEINLIFENIVINLMNSLSCLAHEGINNEMLSKNLIQAIVNVFWSVNYVDNEFSSRSNNIWREVYKCIENSDLSSLRSSSLASILNMSERHFGRKFFHDHGVTPYQFIINMKIKKAIHYLCVSNFPLSEVALLSGFNDQSQFSSVFKKKMGMSPLEYRLAHS